MMVSEQQTRVMVKKLRAAGFVEQRTVGSHTWWKSENGTTISVPDGHRVQTPGLVRKIEKAIEDSKNG